MNNLEFVKIVTEETRLRIINILLKGKCCSSMLTNILNEDEHEIEKAMNKLKKYNIVHAEKVGTSLFYSLTEKASDHISTIQNLIGDVCTEGLYSKDRKTITDFKKNCDKHG